MFWDQYNLFVQGSFNGIPLLGDQSVLYSFKIYKKNFKGTAKNALCGPNPMTHKFLSDEPMPQVKGSELNLTLVNMGDLPLSSFYSDEDDTYRIDVEASYSEIDPDNPPTIIPVTKTIFKGFLIQEDCQEVLTDFGHEIKLSFTDNLGVLKNVPFDYAIKVSPISSTALRQDIMAVAIITADYTAGFGWRLYVSKTTGSPTVGDFVTVQRAGDANGTYEILKITSVPLLPGYWLYIKENPPAVSMTPASALVTYVTATNINDRIKLSDCLRACLMSTNMLINLRYIGNVLPVNDTTIYSRFLENVYIDSRSFSQDSVWDNCYSVLEKISLKFGLTIFQSDGEWHVIRYNEMRYYNNAMASFVYTPYLIYSSSQSPYTKMMTIGNGTVQEGAQETLVRSLKSYTEQLNYTQIPNTLYNGNLTELGVFVQRLTYTTGGVPYYVRYYEAVGFDFEPGMSDYKAYICIITRQDNGIEVDRFLRIMQVSGTLNQQYKVVKSKKIEVNKGDRIKIQWQQNPWNSTGNNIYSFFQIETGTSASQKYFLTMFKNDENQYFWQTLDNLDINPLIYPYKTPIKKPGVDGLPKVQPPEYYKIYNDLDNYEAESMTIPADGVFYIYYGFQAQGGFLCMDFKGFNVEIIRAFEKVGHQNQAFISNSIHNSDTKEISIDDSIMNSIKGTLFFNSFDNLVQRRTRVWRDGQTTSEYSLGEIQTKQIELWRNKIRSKLELTMFPIVKNYKRIRICDIIIFSPKAGKYYIFGQAEFNYKENQISCTLYELWRDGEATNQGISQDPKVKYEFKFLYK